MKIWRDNIPKEKMQNQSPTNESFIYKRNCENHETKLIKL